MTTTTTTYTTSNTTSHTYNIHTYLVPFKFLFKLKIDMGEGETPKIMTRLNIDSSHHTTSENTIEKTDMK
jgi:hypothetical protein